MTKTVWKEEIETIKNLLKEGISITEIGNNYGVSKQRIYQVMSKFGLETNIYKRKNFIRDLPPKYYWLNKMLCKKGLSSKDRLELLQTMKIPDKCPALGIELDYEGSGGNGWRGRSENSPSIDRINSNIGYNKNNIQILSWRANRIKNDSTPEELLLIYKYLTK